MDRLPSDCVLQTPRLVPLCPLYCCNGSSEMDDNERIHNLYMYTLSPTSEGSVGFGPLPP